MRVHKITTLAVAFTVVIAFTMIAAITVAEASAESVIRSAARHNRYVVIIFYKGNDSTSKEMLADVKSLRGKYADRADFVSVDVGDKANRGIVTRYGADRSPIPLTITVAPNGAVTAGFPRQINKSTFADAFVSKGTADVLKVMQARRIAAVCVQNGKTKHNKECQTTARGVKADSRLGGAVEIVTIDPSSESKLLKQWGVNGKSSNAQLVVIAPPGRVMGKFDGAASKASVMASLTRSMSGGCSGGSCGPGGCK